VPLAAVPDDPLEVEDDDPLPVTDENPSLPDPPEALALAAVVNVTTVEAPMFVS